MMFVFISSWWRSLRLVVLVFEGCLELYGGVLLLAVGCLLLCDHYVWSYWFSKNVSTSQGCVTLCCRLLVIVRSLRLVVLVFDECLELHGGVLLFAVGCWSMCDRYDRLYWFSTILVVPAFCTTSDSSFLAFAGPLGLYKESFSIFLLFGDLPSNLCSVFL